jgi:transposase-like protein
MIKANCPFCAREGFSTEVRFHVQRFGHFRRKSDAKRIQRFRCLRCRKSFSTATGHPCFGQNKRQINHRLWLLLNSGVSQRRAARLLRVSRTTISRKFCYLGIRALAELKESNLSKQKISIVEFDDLETFELTKCKPLSVTLGVESRTRRILAFEVAKMAAKGKLAKLARKKYGVRRDERAQARKRFFESLKPLVLESATFKSDENPYYPKDLKAQFPASTHLTFKGKRGSIVGQGELKKIRFDPLFSLNHTCAMLRANISRLFRRTWNTTKIPERLTYHIAIYANFHNKYLIEDS